MRMTLMKTAPVALAALLFAGCSSITNLTPSQTGRSPDGFYPIEAQWRTRDQSLKTSTLEGHVVVGNESYPMKRTPFVKDRWEAFIPVDPGDSIVHYFFKFDFENKRFPQLQKNSLLSDEYTLKILKGK
jgi:uncharacterized protein YceK